jgi:predicted permease
MRWLDAARTRLRLLFARGAAESRMEREFQFHIEMETERLVLTKGLSPEEARRRALAAFGGVETHKEALRDGRGLAWLGAVPLDLTLGLRMLVKYPGLTLVGSFAIAVAIAVGAIFFETIGAVVHSTLPVEDGGRVVALQLATDMPGSPERRVLRDFLSWRENLTSLEALGVYRNVEQNLRAAGAAPQPIRIAEISSAAFRVVRTPPLLGRHLVAEDERLAAAAVVVIGHEAWQSRFAGDPLIVGRSITLGTTPHVVVGVMPAGFAFPVDHQFWTPFRPDPTSYERLEGPELRVFGRLKPGVTLAAAQTELTLVGERLAAASPPSDRRLRPVVLPYTREHFEITGARAWLLWLVQAVVSGLLVVVAINLAIIFYARTVARLGEIAVRSALGASRDRILGQLFAEALVLTGVGAAAGLLVANVALVQMQSWIDSVERMPFWIDLRLSAWTVAYSALLAVLAAAILGVLPGLKATGRPLHRYLRDWSGGNRARLGGLWTSLVVAQVAIAVAILPATVWLVSEVVLMQTAGAGFPPDEFLVAKFKLGDQRRADLVSRLQAQPGVSAVTFSSFIPAYEPGRFIELERPAPDARIVETNSTHVDPRMFDAYGARLLAGRGFDPRDLGEAATSVVVNHAFVRRFLGDKTPLGHRFRYTRGWKEDPGSHAAWYEIVGVVSDYPSFPPSPGSDGQPTVYHAASIDQMPSGVLSVRLKGAVSDDFISRFRQIIAETDPTLPLRDVTRLSDFYRQNRSPWRYIACALSIVTTSVLLLSAAGMYALMSFTVAGRTREIGIRTALGAQPGRLLAGIFARVVGQLTLGWLVGSLLSVGVLAAAGLTFGHAAGLLLVVGGIVLGIGLLAALGPARRGLRIQAVDALKAEG